MAKKDYAAELAELRERLKETEQDAEEQRAQSQTVIAEYAAENERLKQGLDSAKIEIMRIKAHAYDLMVEREAF